MTDHGARAQAGVNQVNAGVSGGYQGGVLGEQNTGYGNLSARAGGDYAALVVQHAPTGGRNGQQVGGHRGQAVAYSLVNSY